MSLGSEAPVRSQASSNVAHSPLGPKGRGQGRARSPHSAGAASHDPSRVVRQAVRSYAGRNARATQVRPAGDSAKSESDGVRPARIRSRNETAWPRADLSDASSLRRNASSSSRGRKDGLRAEKAHPLTVEFDGFGPVAPCILRDDFPPPGQAGAAAGG